MPKQRSPEPRKIDWAAFVEARRLDELRRQNCRPSQMLHRHSLTWRDPDEPHIPKFLGSSFLSLQERQKINEARTDLVGRMLRLIRKG